MGFIFRLRRSVSLLVVMAMVSLVGSVAFARTLQTTSPTGHAAPSAQMAKYGQPLTDAELEDVDGEVWNIVLGVLSGAVAGGLEYTVEHWGHWDYDEFNKSAASYAATSAVASAFMSPALGTLVGSVVSGYLGRLRNR